MEQFFFSKKNWRMRILSAPYFSKFFGGKIKIFNMGYLDEHLATNLYWIQNKAFTHHY